jgi:hypothetical protein
VDTPLIDYSLNVNHPVNPLGNPNHPYRQLLAGSASSTGIMLWTRLTGGSCSGAVARVENPELDEGPSSIRYTLRWAAWLCEGRRLCINLHRHPANTVTVRGVLVADAPGVCGQARRELACESASAFLPSPAVQASASACIHVSSLYCVKQGRPVLGRYPCLQDIEF